jgi:hypothetical protein
MRVYRKRLIPNLDERMRSKEATNESLAAVSGVSHRTVNRARLQHPIQVSLADWIEEALDTKSFHYSKRGPKTANC